MEIDERHLYRKFACSSVYHYAARHLKLAGHTVAEYLRTARKLKELPLLAEAYEKGELSATHVREITRVATAATDGTWLAAARSCTTREIEKLVAFTPEGAFPPGMRPVEEGMEGALHGGQQESLRKGRQGGRLEGLTGDGILGQDNPGGEGFPGPATMDDRGPATEDPGDDCVRDQGAQPCRHKMVLEFEAPDMAVIQAAFTRARKETGRFDRNALVLHMARCFTIICHRGSHGARPPRARGPLPPRPSERCSAIPKFA